MCSLNVFFFLPSSRIYRPFAAGFRAAKLRREEKSVKSRKRKRKNKEKMAADTGKNRMEGRGAIRQASEDIKRERA